MKKPPLVINFFGGPGSGKSTMAARIFSDMKRMGREVELITEYIKDKVWEGSTAILENQAYIFGHQSFRQSRCADKVDIIVTDSPLPLSIYYNKTPYLGESFYQTVMDTFNAYDNLNFLLNRAHPYNPVGRYQTEYEANQVDLGIKRILRERRVPYTIAVGNDKGHQFILWKIQDVWKKRQHAD